MAGPPTRRGAAVAHRAARPPTTRAATRSRRRGTSGRWRSRRAWTAVATAARRPRCRLSGVEAHDGERAQAGLVRRGRRRRAVEELLGLAVPGDRRQPVLERAVADDLAVALERRARRCASTDGLHEVEVGQLRGHDETDGVAVLARGHAGGVVLRVVDDFGIAGVGDVDTRTRVADRWSSSPVLGCRARRRGRRPGASPPVLRRARVGKRERRELLGLGAGDVVGEQVAVAEPHQQRAVGLDDVGLVDARLLHVGAGRRFPSRARWRAARVPQAPRPQHCRPARPSALTGRGARPTCRRRTASPSPSAVTRSAPRSTYQSSSSLAGGDRPGAARRGGRRAPGRPRWRGGCRTADATAATAMPR